MAKYTCLLKTICENIFFAKNPIEKEQLFFEPVQSMNDIWENNFDTNYKSPFDVSRQMPSYNEIIDSTFSDIFSFTFPIYDPELKNVVPSIENGVFNKKAEELCKKIIKHYYMREIGFETIELWKMRLEEKLNLIMPFYNQLYASEEFNKDNPLENHSLEDSSNRNVTTSNSSSNVDTGNSNSNQNSVFQDTPTSELGDENYATGITDTKTQNNSTDTSKTEANGNSTDNYTRNVHGLSNYSKQDMLQRYRENLMNIDENIVRDLYDLFMVIL